jgi:TetR/AcrR family transcriptional regulator of autoinduction and epiphytic fitness
LTRPAPDARQRRLLDAALATFTRFGFRKTSMEEVARAAHVSRQGLYLHFPTKEALFRAVIQHAVEAGLALARARIGDDDRTIEERLIGAFDEWTGRYVGMVGENVADLHEATALLGGEVIAEHDERFLELIVKAIKGSKLPAAFKAHQISARQLAETLHAVARGLKHSCTSRADFVERMGVAVRALCRA